MMFQLIADCEIDAEDLEDACNRLAKYFTAEDDAFMDNARLLTGGYLDLASTEPDPPDDLEGNHDDPVQ